IEGINILPFEVDKLKEHYAKENDSILRLTGPRDVPLLPYSPPTPPRPIQSRRPLTPLEEAVYNITLKHSKDDPETIEWLRTYKGPINDGTNTDNEMLLQLAQFRAEAVNANDFQEVEYIDRVIGESGRRLPRPPIKPLTPEEEELAQAHHEMSSQIPSIGDLQLLSPHDRQLLIDRLQTTIRSHDEPVPQYASPKRDDGEVDLGDVLAEAEHDAQQFAQQSVVPFGYPTPRVDEQTEQRRGRAVPRRSEVDRLNEASIHNRSTTEAERNYDKGRGISGHRGEPRESREWRNIQLDTAKRLEVLMGELGAGNNNPQIKNEIFKILDFLLRHKLLTKPAHKRIVKAVKLIPMQK
ncbi:MAG: hypothetical protein RBS48_06175, partial [Ignavibacteriaceae bacterium]|nr:hypothetical protein [Ignavibacteriaceae bacterium]